MIRFIVITEDNDGGYRIQLRSRLAGTPDFPPSRKEKQLSDAKRTASRIFCDGLRWQTRDEVGLNGQPYVCCVAEVEFTPRV